MVAGTEQFFDWYELTSSCEYWASADILRSAKLFARGAANAMSVLVQAYDNSSSVFSFDQFDQSRQITPEEFFRTYSEIIDGIVNKSAGSILKNGKSAIAPEVYQLFDQNRIIRVFSIRNEWNDKQYLVETETDWTLFIWGTGA